RPRRSGCQGAQIGDRRVPVRSLPGRRRRVRPEHPGKIEGGTRQLGPPPRNGPCRYHPTLPPRSGRPADVPTGDPGVVAGTSDAGVAGGLPAPAAFQAVVAPSTDGEFNTARLRLIPVACWRVEDVRFQFGSSFVLPALKDEMRLLAALISEHSKGTGAEAQR